MSGRFTTGSTMRHVVVMTVTGSAGLMFMFLVDAVTLLWVAQVEDAAATAGLGYAWTIQFFTISASIGMMIATVALVSRALGQGARQRARETATATLIFGVAAQSALAALALAFRDTLVGWAGASGEVADIAGRFLAITMPSLPVMAVGMLTGAVLRAEGDGPRAMMITMNMGLVAVVLDPIVIWWLGFGADGAAWVMGASRLAAAVTGLWYCLWTYDLYARPSGPALARTAWPFALVAVPAVATQLSTPVGNAILMRVVSQFGESAEAGWSVVSRFTVLAFGGIFALSGAIGGIIGQNHGAGLPWRVRSAYRDALIFCTVYTLAVWAGLALAADGIALAYGLTGEGREVLVAFCRYAAGGLVFTGFLFVSNAAFNNLDRPIYATACNWARDGLVMYPVALWATAAFAAPGVAYANVLANVAVGSLAALWAWHHLSRGQGRPVAAAEARPHI